MLPSAVLRRSRAANGAASASLPLCGSSSPAPTTPLPGLPIVAPGPTVARRGINLNAAPSDRVKRRQQHRGFERQHRIEQIALSLHSTGQADPAQLQFELNLLRQLEDGSEQNPRPLFQPPPTSPPPQSQMPSSSDPNAYFPLHEQLQLDLFGLSASPPLSSSSALSPPSSPSPPSAASASRSPTEPQQDVTRSPDCG